MASHLGQTIVSGRDNRVSEEEQRQWEKGPLLRSCDGGLELTAGGGAPDAGPGISSVKLFKGSCREKARRACSDLR